MPSASVTCHAAYLANPDNALVARDDVEPLSAVDPRQAQELAALLRAAYTVGGQAPLKLMLSQDDAAGAFGLQQRGTAVEHQPAGAAHADQLAAGRQSQQPGAVDPGRERERHLRARGVIDRALQVAGLVLGAAGANAVVRDVAAERACGLRGRRSVRRQRKRAGDAGGGCSDQMTAVDVHGHGPRNIRER